MIELLSEYEVNGSGLLVKHRDHYVHSVYVFILGLAVYQKNALYRKSYNEYYNLKRPYVRGTAKKRHIISCGTGE